MIDSFPTYAPGDMPTAEEFNRLCRAVELLSKLAASPPLQMNQDASGYTISLEDEAFVGNTEMVNVTSLTPVGDYYPAIIQTWDGSDWQDGDECYFLPANGETPALQRYGSIFEITDPETGLDVYSEEVDEGNLTVKSSDGSVSYSPIDTLAFDQNTIHTSIDEFTRTATMSGYQRWAATTNNNAVSYSMPSGDSFNSLPGNATGAVLGQLVASRAVVGDFYNSTTKKMVATYPGMYLIGAYVDIALSAGVFGNQDGYASVTASNGTFFSQGLISTVYAIGQYQRVQAFTWFNSLAGGEEFFLGFTHNSVDGQTPPVPCSLSVRGFGMFLAYLGEATA